VEPRARHAPFASYRPLGHPERLGDLLLAEPAEEPHLDDVALPRIDVAQAGEAFVDGEHFLGPSRIDDRAFLEIDANLVAAALDGCARGPGDSRDTSPPSVHTHERFTLAGSRTAQVGAKRLLRGQAVPHLETALRLETLGIRDAADSPDGREGVQAFLEKRRPAFGGR